MKLIILTLVGVMLAGCDALTKETSDARGSSEETLTMGGQVFQDNCQTCHGIKARGAVLDWQKRSADGVLPAPPLNGTAHAWHHSDKALLRTINQGGIPLGGTMPAFKDTLSKDEKLAVLAYIKSLWPDELYEAWRERNG